MPQPALALSVGIRLDAASRRDLAEATDLAPEAKAAVEAGDPDLTVAVFEAMVSYLLDHSILSMLEGDVDANYTIDDPDDGPDLSEATVARLRLQVITSPANFTRLRDWALIPPPPPGVPRMIFEDELRMGIRAVIESGG